MAENNTQKTISEIDVQNLQIIRVNVSTFLARCGLQHDANSKRVLDIAPQIHAGAAPHFPKSTLQTLDIDQKSSATYIANICRDNSAYIDSEAFDIVVCTEVLEHTLDPFAAVREIHRILSPAGLALITVPFNLRIHGPLPDCWRFTEHGLRALFANWNIVELNQIEDPERFLMPICYSLIAEKT